MAQPALRGLEPERVTRVRPSCFISVRNRVKFRFSHSQLSRGLSRLDSECCCLFCASSLAAPPGPAARGRAAQGRLLA